MNVGRQLTTFNHQGTILIGGKAAVNGRPVAAYQGIIAGYLIVTYLFNNCAFVQYHATSSGV